MENLNLGLTDQPQPPEQDSEPSGTQLSSSLAAPNRTRNLNQAEVSVLPACPSETDCSLGG